MVASLDMTTALWVTWTDYVNARCWRRGLVGDPVLLRRPRQPRPEVVGAYTSYEQAVATMELMLIAARGLQARGVAR